MTKLRKLQEKVKELPKKKKDQGAIGKVVKKKAATLTQKKKETIVQNIISTKDELVNKVSLKKNKVESNFKAEQQKSNVNLKKNKNTSKLVLAPKTEISKSKGVTKKNKKHAKLDLVLNQEILEPQVIPQKKKSKDKPTVGLKGKKVKSTVISKRTAKTIKKPIVLKEEKTKLVTEKNKGKSKPIPVPEKEKLISKVLSKKEKSNLKKVLVPREEKNTVVAISKKSKQKSKLPTAPKEEKNELKTVSKKAKRKAESVLQKENTRPEVVKKAKVSKGVAADLEKEGSQDVITKKKGKVTKDPLKRKNLEHYVKALLKVVDVGEQKRRTLFTSEKPPLFLTITCVKVPKAPLYQMRFELPHTLVSPTDDVALFVKDLKRGRRREFDDTIHHFEDLLQKHGCTRIKSVIPINQVKTDYRQYEMRRRLLGSYDHFLCDGRIAGHLAHLLGKTFRESRKLPISIHMDKKDLKEEIDRALKKTSLQIHSNGDTYVTQFATCSMSMDEIIDNLLSVIQELHKSFPGGWNNVRSLRIKSPLSMAIPIYMTLKTKNDVEAPVVEPKRPKAYKSVEGELSTFTSNVHVKVAPDGTVDIQKMGGEDSDEDDENLDDIEEEEKNGNKAVEHEIKEEEEEDDDEDEDVDESNDEEEEEEDDDENENDSDD